MFPFLFLSLFGVNAGVTLLFLVRKDLLHMAALYSCLAPDMTMTSHEYFGTPLRKLTLRTESLEHVFILILRSIGSV